MQTIKLNLIPGSVLPVVNVSQYDVGRQFALSVYEGASSYSLSGKSVEIRGTKPDGNGFAYDATDGVVSVSGNTVTISTTQQMTAVGGQTMAELRITSGDTILGTLNFVLMVEPSALSDDTPISDTDIPAIERGFEAALEEAQAAAQTATTKAGEASTSATNAASSATTATNAAETATTQARYASSSAESAGLYDQRCGQWATRAETAATNAEGSATEASESVTDAEEMALVAEGYANGKQNGVPVSSGSPYYHNNAEYFSNLANPTSLASMTDVDITEPADGEVLAYDSTAQKWKNRPDATSGMLKADGSVLADKLNITDGESTTSPTGSYSLVVGQDAFASGDNALAVGYLAGATGNNSVAFNRGRSGGANSVSMANASTSYQYEVACGEYNEQKSTTYFEVGNGSGSNSRANAFEVYKNGDTNTAGDIKKNGTNLIGLTTTDPGAGSALETGALLIVIE